MSEPNMIGVALTKCYFCQKDDCIVINTRLGTLNAAKVEKMHGKTISMEPCQKCADLMKMGIILITIDDAKSGEGWNKPPLRNDEREGWIPNPYRTGGWFVITDDAAKRMFPQMADWAIKHRFMFIEHEAAKMIGLFDATPEEVK